MDVSKKIKPIDELCELLSREKAKCNKVVQCHGIFDIIHPGIVRHIESAKKFGDILVVTIIKDKDVSKGPNYPIFNEKLRAENVASIAYVDYVTIVDDVPSYECVKILKPDVFARGQDSKDRDPNVMKRLEDEEEALRIAGCKVHYTEGETFSSTSIINQFLDIYSEETKCYLRNFRRKYRAIDVTRSLESLKELKVLIVGDTIIDEYHYCESMGKSSKDPLVVNRYISEEVFAGGSAAVANHVSGLCDNVQLVTLLGNDSFGEKFISSKLRLNVKTKFFFRQDAPVIVKKRYIDQYLRQKLFEICYIKNDEIPIKLERLILDYLAKQIPRYDLVMVCDFGHGLITKRLIELVEDKAEFLAVNVQTNGANAGFNIVTKYHKVNFACLDEPELRLACQDRFGKVEDLAKKITKCINTDNLIVTRGKLGSIGVNSDSGFNITPAFSSIVVDRTGSGDAFFSFTAPCFAKGLALDLVSFVGNVAGAIAVQIVCNRESVEPKKLFQFIHTLLR